MRQFAYLCAIVLAGIACLTFSVRSARAATRDIRLVTKAADTNDGTCDADCSLREAIAAATPADTINFAGDYAIVLGLGELTISKSLTIDATGHTVSVSGNDAVRVFEISSGTVVITGLTITHGFADQDNGGGLLVLNNSVTFTLNNSTVSFNHATYDGGGMRTNFPNTTISHSSFIKNTAGTYGGGIALVGGTLSVEGSSFFKNSAGDAGAIYADTGSTALTVANSTIYRTKSHSGIYARIPITIYNSTIYKTNYFGVGSGLVLPTGSLDLRNTIVFASASIDCNVAPGVTIVSNVDNLAGDKSCKKSGTGYLKANPLLGEYKTYGGTTKVFSLLDGSPAINTGDDATCAAPPVNGVDQRGKTRPKGAHCDRGAYERK